MFHKLHMRVGKPRRLAWLLPVSALSVGAFIAAAAHADDARWELSAGASETLETEWTGVLFAERIGDAHAIGSLTWRPAAALGLVDARSTQRADLDQEIGIAALGARLHFGDHFFIAAQPAVNAGGSAALSGHFQFVSSLGWQGGRWQLMLRHISNADIKEPNHGEAMIVAGL